MFVNFSYFYQLTFLFVRALFGKNSKFSDARSPAGHIGRGLGAIRALLIFNSCTVRFGPGIIYVRKIWIECQYKNVPYISAQSGIIDKNGCPSLRNEHRRRPNASWYSHEKPIALDGNVRTSLYYSNMYTPTVLTFQPKMGYQRQFY